MVQASSSFFDQNGRWDGPASTHALPSIP
jgi:hypothetical protein